MKMLQKPKFVSSSKKPANHKGAASKKVSKETKEKERQEKLKQVKLQLITIETELENEKKQRNKLQIERDKLQQFWGISRDQAKQIKRELFDGSRESNEINSKLQTDIAYLNEKIAFLMRDSEREITKINQSQGYQDDMNNPDNPIQDQKNSSIWHNIDEDRKNLLLEKDEEIESQRLEFEKIIALNKEAFENEKRALKSSLINHHREEMRKFKLAKIQQFDELLNHHQTQIQQLQESYDIEIKKQLDEIDSLKVSIVALKEKLADTEGRYNGAIEENLQFKNQIENLNKNSENISKDLKNFDRMKRDAEMYKKQFKQTKSSLQEWKEKYEILNQNLSKIEKERDQLYSHFQEAIGQIQNRASEQKNILNQQIFKAEQNIQMRRNEIVPESHGLERL